MRSGRGVWAASFRCQSDSQISRSSRESDVIISVIKTESIIEHVLLAGSRSGCLC